VERTRSCGERHQRPSGTSTTISRADSRRRWPAGRRVACRFLGNPQHGLPTQTRTLDWVTARNLSNDRILSLAGTAAVSFGGYVIAHLCTSYRQRSR
jgi:hypothetical protein